MNSFGQRFQENGYQMPGTEDGGTTLKRLLGGPLDGATLGEVTNFFAVRLRGEVRQADFKVDEGATDDIDIAVPTIINLFFAGTATKNISFFLEGEYNDEEEGRDLGFERVILVYDNLGRHQLANFKIGKFDPSAFYPFPTHRQQMNPIPPEADTGVFPPEIERIPVLPFAFSSKMFGLTMGPAKVGEEGYSILPFEPFFFNSPAEKGATVYGRPFGPKFLYQVGVVQGDTAEDVQDTRWDWYAMLRYDTVYGEFADIQFSGFYYHAPDAARPTLGGPIYAEPVDWDRYGIAARWRHKMFDVYGTIIWDEIDDVSFAVATGSEWDTSALGASIEMDWLVHAKLLLSARYDFMNPGGLKRLPPAVQGSDPDINQEASFLGVLAKYYPVPNIGFYSRAHFNLRDSVAWPAALPGEIHPARNLEYIATIGVDMAF